MALEPQLPEMSLDEFLVWEAQQATKHEFANGRVYAMAGASRTHGTIVLNVAALLRPAIRGSHCRAYVADMKVVSAKRNAARYPDLVLTCDRRDLDDEHVTRYPKLIVEIASPSTAAIDRGQKFEEYRSISTLLEYVVIDSTRVLAQLWRREDRGWLLQEFGPGDTFRLESIPLDIRVDDLYEDVALGRIERFVTDE